MQSDSVERTFTRKNYRKKRLDDYLENFPKKKVKIEKEGFISGLFNKLTKNSVEVITGIGKGIVNRIE